MVLQPMGCGRVGHRHNTPTEAARDSTVSGRFTALPNAISALLNAFFADVTLHGVGYPHEPPQPRPATQQALRAQARCPQVWLAASLGRQTNTAVRSTASRPTSRMQFGRPNFPWHPHERCNPNQKHSKTKNRHKTKTNKHTIEFTNNTHTPQTTKPQSPATHSSEPPPQTHRPAATGE